MTAELQELEQQFLDFEEGTYDDGPEPAKLFSDINADLARATALSGAAAWHLTSRRQQPSLPCLDDLPSHMLTGIDEDSCDLLCPIFRGGGGGHSGAFEVLEDPESSVDVSNGGRG